MTKSVTVTFLFRLEGLKLNDTDWINDFKEKRTQYGVSQNRLAVMAGVSREYVSRIESGKVALTEEIKGKFTDALEKLNPDNPLEMVFDYVRIRFPTQDVKHVVEDTTMLLSFIPKGLVSQQEVIDELSTMRKNVERLEKYVNAMTNLYRLEDIEIEKETINFNLLLKALSDTTELLCTDIKYSIKTSCNNNENLFINLDIVVQIYENLLSNSIRYANSMIDIDISMKKQYLLISVSDDGCGFKDSDIERVTLPFYKSSQDTTTEHLGLGLNICKILCERHGGTLKIANNDKGGACVTAWIKIIDVDEK